MIGKTLLHYEVTARIGAGGMGEVYRATDTKLGREVAIKVLPAELVKNEERLTRFRREARVLAALNHPRIAAIHGLEEDDGIPFLVLELVEGEDLAERLARGAISVDEALATARGIAEALEEAHEKGIVHRDLKPANVKLTADGGVKVLDFGLAKVRVDEAADERASSPTLSDSPTLAHTGTAAGVILGTAAYMSPEQAKGQPVDRRADLWAFGCLLYEMLTGTRCFGGETVTEVLAAVVRDEPDWSRLPAATPPAARDLLRRCLRKDVRRRLQAIGEARVRIQEVLAGEAEPGVAAQAPAPSRGLRALPWLAGAAAGALIATVALGGLAPRAPRRAPMLFRGVTNFAGVQAQPALSPDGGSVAFVSNRGGDYDIYVGLVAGGNLVQITEGHHAKAGPTWSPDGATIAYARLSDGGTWDVWQVHAFGGTPRRLITNATDPAWSRDGNLLAYANMATGTIWISDPAGQEGRQLTPVAPSGYGPAGLPAGYGFHDAEPSFSPDGRELAYVTRTGGPYGELRVIDLASGEVRQLTHDSALAQSPAWSPDGLHVYFASSRGGAMNIWKIAAAGGEPEQITAGQGDDAQPDVSFDGSRLVFATYSEQIGIAGMDLEAEAGTASTTRLTTDPARNFFAPVYSPDGSRIAYFSNFKGLENEAIWVAGSDGSDPVPLVQDPRRVSVFPRWSPDGESLIFMSEPPTQAVDGEYRRVSISGGAPDELVDKAIDFFHDVGPDGRLLYRDPDGRIATYDPATRKSEVLTGSSLSRRGQILRWSPDGREIAYRLPPRHENDPDAGLWVEDLDGSPRQIFRGWVTWYVRGPEGRIWLHEGTPDLKVVLWSVGWNGERPTRHSVMPRVHSYWTEGASGLQTFFDVSPDGRRIAFVTQEVLQANIGLIDNVR